jgi:prevent-host-death family protein
VTRIVTATEASRTFLRLLEEVKMGVTITIARYGTPAAVIVPAGTYAKRKADE